MIKNFENFDEAKGTAGDLLEKEQKVLLKDLSKKIKALKFMGSNVEYAGYESAKKDILNIIKNIK